MIAIDAITSELAKRRWSLGDLSFYDGATVVWQVFGHSDEQRVLARAPTQNAAWTMAAIQIVKIRTAAFLDRLMEIERELKTTGPDADGNRNSLEESDQIEFELGRDYVFERDWLE